MKEKIPPSSHIVDVNDENKCPRKPRNIFHIKQMEDHVTRPRRACVIVQERNPTRYIEEIVEIRSPPRRVGPTGRPRGRPRVRHDDDCHIYSSDFANLCSYLQNNYQPKSTFLEWHQKLARHDARLTHEGVGKIRSLVNRQIQLTSRPKNNQYNVRPSFTMRSQCENSKAVMPPNFVSQMPPIQQIYPPFPNNMSDQYYMQYPLYNNNAMYGNMSSFIQLQPQPINHNYMERETFQRTLPHNQGMFLPFNYNEHQNILRMQRNHENRPLNQ